MKYPREVIDQGVVIRKLRRTWWLDVHRDQKRTRRNLGTADVRKARIIARELAASIIAGTWNIAAASTLSVTAAVEEYRKSRADHAEETRTQVERMLGAFSSWCESRRIVSLDRLRVEDIDSFRDHVKVSGTRSRGSVTVNLFLAWVTGLLSWAVDRGYIRVNVATKARRLKVEHRVRRVLTGPESSIGVNAFENLSIGFSNRLLTRTTWKAARVALG